MTSRRWECALDRHLGRGCTLAFTSSGRWDLDAPPHSLPITECRRHRAMAWSQHDGVFRVLSGGSRQQPSRDECSFGRRPYLKAL